MAGARVADSRLVDSRQLVDAPEIGPIVVYLQLNSGDDLALYRQRVLVFTADGDTVVQRAYVIEQPERFTDAVSGDPALAELTADEITPMFDAGCAQRWRRDAGGFRGYTDPATCRIISSRTGKPRRIEAETRLTQHSLAVAERGYDDEMNQLFGSAPGELTVLYRVSEGR